jgi:2-methylcitrate dehydratase PrpD
MTHVEEIAEWASGVGAEDIPPRVLDIARAQRRSVLAGVAASSGNEAAEHVLDAVDHWAGNGPAPLAGRERSVPVEDALFASAAMSVALDFDDYLLFGHTGHSAVLLPILLAAETGTAGTEQLVAQVIGNEVGARLGGACVLGPLNGQMWSFVHSGAAALASGRMLGLNRRQMGHALGIALYQAPRATVPGFFGPESKLLTAAEPAVAGLRAARLAAAGVTGPLDALDAEEGFLGTFADVPLRGMLGGLGEAWATSTLSVKPYPGCAYMDSAVDALIELLGGVPAPPGTVGSVEVSAGLLTFAMNSMSVSHLRRRSAGEMPSPVAVNFSIPWSLGIVLLEGGLAPLHFTRQWRKANGSSLAQAAGLVSIGLDASSSMESAGEFGKVLPPRALLAEAGLAGIARTVRRSGLSAIGGSVPDRIRRMGGFMDPRVFLGLAARLSGRSPSARGWWDSEALGTFSMEIPARVVMRTKSGSVADSTVRVPRGAVGHPTCGPEQVAKEKLLSFGPMLYGEQGTEIIDGAVARDDPRLFRLIAK